MYLKLFGQLGFRNGHTAGVEECAQDAFNHGFSYAMRSLNKLAEIKGILL